MNSPKLTQPSEIARETLKQLAVRRVPPTPDNYEELYHEISGNGNTSHKHGNVLYDELLRSLKSLPDQNAELKSVLSHIQRAAAMRSWQSMPALIMQAAATQPLPGMAQPWPDLIKELITQWDLRNPHFTASRKRESLQRVLINFGSQPNLLNEKLDALIKGWADGATGGGDIEVIESEPLARPADSAVTVQPVSDGMDWRVWRGLLVQVMRQGMAERLQGMPELAEEATSLALAAESLTSSAGLDFLVQRLNKFWLQLEIRAERDNRVANGLIGLLLLLTDNLAALSGYDQWTAGQVSVLRDLLARPLTMTRLYEVEAGLKEVVIKQKQLRNSLDEAQESIKDMLGLFISRLGGITNSTSGYQGKIEGYADRIAEVQDVGQLKHLVDELMQDTKVMQLDVSRTRDELEAARNQADAASVRVVELEKELRVVSEKIREDQLTGALNRRGFDEAYAAERSRARRSTKTLCLSLLDIDNFKKLNDSRGHQAGDDALRHLVAVVKDVVRPTDVVSRYGGEEFVVLLPETPLEEAANIMQRVQRELTRRFFLHNNEKVLITFSAGVTQHVLDEDPDATVERADQAMYQAKKSGKNQVTIADALDHHASG